MRTILARSIALAALSALASATDLVVTPGSSIQAAIDAAVDGDRVLVQPGVYHERLHVSGKSIEVIGLGGAAATTLDADLLGTAVLFDGNAGPTTRLAGFTITRGSTPSLAGGGIAVANGSRPTLEACVVTLNSGKRGGGVSGSPILLGCTILQNTASTGEGGGLWGAPELYDCVVADNSVTSGSGGGLFLTNGAAVLRGCRIEGNRAVFGQGHGAGVYVNSTATAELERCVIVDNFGSSGVFANYGAGVSVEAAGTSVVNCTVVDNLLFGSSTSGGGVHGPALVRNSIVRGNTGSQLSNVTSVTYCDVEGGFAGLGNIDLDPLFVDAASNDFHLGMGSPCIDAGDPLDPVDADGSTVDMGALPYDLPGPSVYCLSAPNSVGAGAHIGWSGSTSLAAADLVLHVDGAPPGMIGIFYYGPQQTQTPFFDGYRCVDSGGLGLFRLVPPVVLGAGGSGSLAVDYDVPPASSGLGAIDPGSVWNFQFWYRDPAALGTGSNLSDALHAAFVP